MERTSAILLLAFGAAMCAISLALPPTGEIDGSVLMLFGQILVRRLRLRRANLHQRPDEPTQKPTQIGGFCASKGLILPLKTPFLGLFGGTFTGFYKNTKSYIVEC